MSPNDISVEQLSAAQLRTNHVSGATAVFTDAHVRRLETTMSIDQLHSIATISLREGEYHILAEQSVAAESELKDRFAGIDSFFRAS